MSAIGEEPVLMKESLDILKEQLAVNPYTDKQLNRAAMWFVSPSLALGARMGVSNDEPQAMYVTANLFARTVMAEFIGAGLISVTAVDRYLDKVEKMILDEAAKAKEVAERGTDGEPAATVS